MVDMKNVSFEPSQLRIPSGQPAKLVVKNSDLFGHTFTIDELGIDYSFLFGDEKLVHLAPLEAGEYTYICTVPGHQNMRGTLVVAE